ncbi:MAG TPA: response regulator [Candidatus Cloacimonadota bacterium]|nr:response regulator [Candidatus Cloacimonadota bacterium]HPT70986.1 response regulator [Candidatus Cloacimonadota bacterium]
MQKQILIVDDEKNIRLTLRRSLETLHFEIQEALTGEEALEMINTQHFDLVLLDLKLPGISGLDVIRQVRNTDNPVKIIIISAHGTIEAAVESMKLGASDFIEKPFTPDEIRQLVLKHIEE